MAEDVPAAAAALVLPFSSITRADVAVVGGKGANLGEMTRAGFPVPPGFCVTTEAFRAFLASSPSTRLNELYDAIAAADAADTNAVKRAGAAMRAHLTSLPMPAALSQAVASAWRDLGAGHAYAVRSSATAEDLPGASFAGQQDTYLNVVGEDALLDRVRACWASLFTDRAITYRKVNGFDDRKVSLSVVVQRQVSPRSAGIMFTADPVDGRRHVVSIDAGFGLGEALVSGLVNADLYKVDKRALPSTSAILAKKVGDKRMAIRAVAGGGTEHVDLDETERHAQVLDDARVLELAALGAKVEAHYGAPQDIEWCIDDADAAGGGGALYLVQARPITTLYPLAQIDDANRALHVLVSFGHAQVMTDAMAPLGLSVWRRVMPFRRDARGDSGALVIAGNRLYADPTELLHSRPFRKRFPNIFRLADASMADAVLDVVDRPEFLARAPAPHSVRKASAARGAFAVLRRIVPRVLRMVLFSDAATVAATTTALMDDHWQKARARMMMSSSSSSPAAVAVAERFAIAVDLLEHVFMDVVLALAPSVAGGLISGALAKRLAKSADPNDFAAVARGLVGNVTTEMDLRVGDLADVVRASPAASAAIAKEGATTDDIARASPEFAAALRKFLDDYGMRGGSEIDITRARWADDPRPLVQFIRGALHKEGARAHRMHHEKMREEAHAALERIVAATSLPWRGFVRKLLLRFRALSAMREHPKLQLVRVLSLLRRAALDGGAALVDAGMLAKADDVWMLDIVELRDALRAIASSSTSVSSAPAPATSELRALIEKRRAELGHNARLAPPRVMTSEGEIVTAKSSRVVPEGALAGTGASAGVVEGVARVVLDPATGVLRAGEILVAPFTDPGWTPLFINAAALVMEVGGQMTHGSVVAREYGIPAVVSVADATKRIHTGQRLLVDGTNGFVRVLG